MGQPGSPGGWTAENICWRKDLIGGNHMGQKNIWGMKDLIEGKHLWE